MEINSDILAIAFTVLELEDSGVLKNPEFLNHLRKIHHKSDKADAKDTASKNAKAIAEFVQKDKENYKPERLYVDGVFDMVHSGHFNAIRQAKALTDNLVIGVVCDHEVEITKGPPVMNDKERAELIGACKWADEVVYEDIPYTPSLDLVDKLNCQFVGHGDDLALTADGEDCYSIIKKAGRMKVFKRTEGISTTDIVSRILALGNDPNRKKKTMDEIQENTTKTSPPFNMNPAAFQLLQTTKRIKVFSSHREIQPSDKVVYVDGAFDLLHVGHVRILKKAREIGTFVVVGVYGDKTVEYIKGKNYPILNLQERALNLMSLKYVDEVVIDAPYMITEQLLNTFNVQIVLEGSNIPLEEKESNESKTNFLREF